MISLDSECLGLDVYHGAKPFYVTISDPEGNITSWEWDVNPETRDPIVPDGDLDHIYELIQNNDELVLQNGKFDCFALSTLQEDFSLNWPWSRTNDTLIAGHLLSSNSRHDLTSMLHQYLT